MRMIVVLMIGGLLSATALSVQAQGLPTAVRAVVQGMDEDCTSNDGRPGDKSGLLRTADLNGDGVRDWVMDDMAYVCDGSISLFSGSGGGQVTVWAGRRDGTVSDPAYFGSFGSVLADNRLWLTVGGPLCGQRVTDRMSRSEYTSCERPVAWTGARFEMAPISEIRAIAGPAAPEPAARPRATASGNTRTQGVSTAWFTGVWVNLGHVCDSGAPVSFNADGTLFSESIEGVWRLEGDVLMETYHTIELGEDTVGPDQNHRSRVARLSEDRLTLTPLDRGRPEEMTRCG